MSAEQVEFLRTVEIFKDVSAKAIERLVALSALVNFKEGQTIIKEGDSGQEMYVIYEGNVRITKNITLRRRGSTETEDVEKDLITLGSGTIFGEMGLLEKDERTATVVAVSDLKLIKIEAAAFERFAKEDPAAAYSIVRNIA